MEISSILSILPPLVAILGALTIRQIHISLILGVFSGWWIINDFNPFKAFLAMLNGFVNVFSDVGNAKMLMFCLLVGGLIQLAQSSGGVSGFVSAVSKKIEGMNFKNEWKKKRLIQVLVVFMGMILFIETSISCLASGAFFRSLFRKHKISRLKLAYLIDSTSAPSGIIFPFNGAGAFLIGLLALEGIGNPVGILLGSLAWNFYPFLAVFGAFSAAFWGLKLGAGFEKTANKELSKSDGETSKAEHQFKKAGKSHWFMTIPLGLMVILMPVFMIYTGFLELEKPFEVAFLKEAFLSGSGSSSVFYSVFLALCVAFLTSLFFKQDTVHHIFEALMKGVKDIFPLVVLMLFAFSLSSICKALGTGVYMSQIISENIPVVFVPALVFFVSGLVAFSTGTSWGTYAIMIPIGVSLATTLNAPPSMIVASVVGGGIFGDHSSPISDTTLLSSIAADCDHIDHVRTQLPYALLAGGITLILLLGASWWMF